MRSTNARVSVSACVHLLNRAWGMPKSEINLTDEIYEMFDKPMTEDEWEAAYGVAPPVAAGNQIIDSKNGSKGA